MCAAGRGLPALRRGPAQPAHLPRPHDPSSWVIRAALAPPAHLTGSFQKQRGNAGAWSGQGAESDVEGAPRPAHARPSTAPGRATARRPAAPGLSAFPPPAGPARPGWALGGRSEERPSAPLSNLLAGAGLGLGSPNAGCGNRSGRAAPRPPGTPDPTGPENSAVSAPPPPRKPPNSLCPRPQEMSFSSSASKQPLTLTTRLKLVINRP